MKLFKDKEYKNNSDKTYKFLISSLLSIFVCISAGSIGNILSASAQNEAFEEYISVSSQLILLCMGRTPACMADGRSDSVQLVLWDPCGQGQRPQNTSEDINDCYGACQCWNPWLVQIQ